MSPQARRGKAKAKAIVPLPPLAVPRSEAQAPQGSSPTLLGQAPKPRTPKYAWWRDLRWWPGTAREGPSAGSGAGGGGGGLTLPPASASSSAGGGAWHSSRDSRGGGGGGRGGASGKKGGGPGGSSRPSVELEVDGILPGSERLREGWGAPPTPSSLGGDIALPRGTPSEHLKWAKHVSSVQNEWFREHRMLKEGRPQPRTGNRGRPRTSPRAARPGPSDTVAAAEAAGEPADWARELRCDVGGSSGSRAGPDAEASQRRRNESALERLKGFQLKWRQEQDRRADRTKDRDKGTSEAVQLGDPEAPHSGGAHPEREVGSNASMGSSGGAASAQWQPPWDNAVPLPFLRTAHAASGTSSKTKSSRETRHSLVLESVETPTLRRSPHGSTPTRSQARSRQASNSPSVGVSKRASSSRGSSSGEMVPGQGCSGAGPSRRGGARRADSPKSSSRASEEKGSGHDPDCDLGGLFGPDGRLLVGRWSPSYVSAEDSSGPATSVASSKRSSTASNPSAARAHAEGASSRAGGPPSFVRRGACGQKALADVAEGEETWEEWRVDFPLAVLDTLADFLESCVLSGPEGQHAMSLADVERIASKVLGFPPTAVRDEVFAQGLLSPQQATGELLFGSLHDFLSFFRGAVDRVEREDVSALWSPDDIRHIADAFQRHASDGMVLVPNLFNLIEDLCFDDLRANTVASQRFLACITTMVMESKVTSAAGMETQREALNAGNALSFEDVVRVVTVALREKEKGRRHEAFRAEQNARRVAGFSLAETEDLRELHRTYASQRTAGADNLASMLSFLSVCGLRQLRKEEEQTLAIILSRHAPGQDSGQPPDHEVPFHAFMLWMKEIFEQHLGDIRWHGGQDPPTLQDLEDRRGFAMAMLRDEIRNAKLLDHGLGGEKRGDGRQQSRGRSRRMKGPARGGGSHGGSHLASSRGSHSASRSRSRSHSRAGTPSAAGVGDPDLDAEGEMVVSLKGLPPPDVLINRKPFRACTPLETTSSFGKAAGSAAGGPPPPAPCTPGSASPPRRTAKPVQDASSIVLGAIAGLSAADLSARDDNDSSAD